VITILFLLFIWAATVVCGCIGVMRGQSAPKPPVRRKYRSPVFPQEKRRVA